VDIKGAIANGVSKEVANKIYDDMSTFASYAFNKSHAAAYTFLTYQTAYLKCYYTVEFIAAVLNNRITSIEEISNFLGYLKDRGFEVKPPSINRSVAEFSVEDGGIRIGMAAIKNVGIDAIESIVEERERGGEFKDFLSFAKRMGENIPNKKQLQSLIYAGTFDCFGLNRSQLIASYEEIVDRVASDRNKTASGQISFFEIVKDDSFDHYDYRDIKEYELGEKLQYEKEVAGVYLTGHPLDQYKEHLKKFKHNVASLFEKTESAEEGEEAEYTIPDDTLVTIGGMIVEAGKRLAKKSGKEFGVGKLEDLYGTVELMLAGFKYNQYKSLFVKDKLVTVTGRVRRRDENISITVDRIETWDSDVKKGASKKICFCISFTQVDESIIDILQNILKAYPGEDMTYIKNLDDNKIYSMGIGTNINPIMYTELCGLIGETNIKIAE
jgi:DNA polymerase-3 subunit alpha